MDIRHELPPDQQAISRLTASAFAPMAYSDGSEPAIIDRLRKDGDLTLSLIAVVGGEIVGHIAFSPVLIGGNDRGWFGLGPVSVAIEKQRRGIGSALITSGLDWLRSQGANGCVLVGDPVYYRRFGFISDGKISYGGLPNELVQWVSFDGTSPAGVLIYRPAFAA
jgi:putative acetyltransferase